MGLLSENKGGTAYITPFADNDIGKGRFQILFFRNCLSEYPADLWSAHS
jgi:hypothetical protein